MRFQPGAACKQLEVAQQRIERRADLVAHGGEEGRARAHHRLGRLLRRAQLVLKRLLRGAVVHRAEQHVVVAVACGRIGDLQEAPGISGQCRGWRCDREAGNCLRPLAANARLIAEGLHQRRRHGPARLHLQQGIGLPV
ncbi:hypothetical protein D3C81_1578900 [compost metagenome]